MANPLTRSKFKDDEIVVATTSLAVEGVDEVIRRGMQLRGNHPAVRKCPQWFVPFGTPESEWPSEWDNAGLERIAEEQRRESERRHCALGPHPHNGECSSTIPEDEVVICIQGFAVFGSAAVEVGARRRRTDPIVKKHPQFFAEPPKPLAAS